MSGSLSTGDPVGMLARAGAGACYAVYTVLGVRLARDGIPASAVLAASFSIGAVLLLPAALSSGWWLSGDGLVVVLWLGLATTTVGYLLFGLGLRELQPGPHRDAQPLRAGGRDACSASSCSASRSASRAGSAACWSSVP